MVEPDDFMELGDYLRSEFPDDAPREPGRARVTMGGEPRTVDTEVECDFCGCVLRWRGVMFGDGPSWSCKIHPGREAECLPLHSHYSEDCPALHWRLRRFKTALTWPIERRWRSWRWRRRMSKDRRDPESWAHFWADTEREE